MRRAFSFLILVALLGLLSQVAFAQLVQVDTIRSGGGVNPPSDGDPIDGDEDEDEDGDVRDLCEISKATLDLDNGTLTIQGDFTLCEELNVLIGVDGGEFMDAMILDPGDGTYITIALPSADPSTCRVIVECTLPFASGCDCDDGKPSELIFRYTGESCDFSSNSQSSFECEGDPAFGTPVTIQLFDDDLVAEPPVVALGEMVVVRAVPLGEQFPSSNTEINVVATADTQELNIHTSCSQDLIVGDTFGSLELVGFVPEGGVEVCGGPITDQCGIDVTIGTQGPTGPQGIQGKLGPQGIQGKMGPQGIQGKLGDTGPQGIQGKLGDTGPQGIQGKLGDTGPQGIQGKIGDTGPQGIQGKIGDTGPQGIQGKIGDTGPQGIQGKMGDPGVTGPQGIQGKIGDTGPQGIQGKIGDPGPQGIQGKMGDPGATGPQGEQGKIGPSGPPGPQGIQGKLGDPGPQGDQGKMGDPGPQGDQGKMGDPGPQGVQGKLGDPGPQGEQGKIGPSGAPGPQGVQGKLGPTGPEGPEGPQGIQGKMGDPGAQGDPGPQGIQGKLGPTGPEGPEGPQGIQGKMGDPGSQGEQGKIGPSGMPGPQGIQGKLGPTGPEGPEGPQGIQGKMGDPGSQGIQGKLGDTGPQGEQGKIGPSGLPGPQGIQGKLGPPGAPFTPDYGISQVWVSRGTAAATPWALYSTTLGGPLHTNGGVFRFSCGADQAPCKVSVQAGVSDALGAPAAATADVYPRILIHRTNFSGGPMEYCEYGDGIDNVGGSATVTGAPVTGPLTAMTLGVGGSLDCGTTSPPQPFTAFAPVDEIWVPEGRYDVWTSFVFSNYVPAP